jgi:hypothetical protein
MNMRCVAVLFCMLCLIFPISAALDESEDADELLLENVEGFGEGVEDFIEVDLSDASTTGPTAADFKFAELLATRAAPAIFATGSAFDTAFYHGNGAALAAVERERTMELNQAAGLIRNVKISEQYEPIRKEFLSRMTRLLSEVRSAGGLKQGCSKCVADIKKLNDNAHNFGVWTIQSISEIA